MGTSAGPDAGLERFLQRYSVGPKHLRDPVPGDDELALAALAALRAPDHGKLAPYTFVRLTPPQRPLLAELFAAMARHEGRSEAEIEVERDRALRAPMLLAFLVRIRDSAEAAEHEQWLAAGGALANFMMALHLMGYGSKMLSGRKVDDPAIRRAFCRPGERLVGWIAVGTPSEPPHPRRNDNPDEVLRTWDAPCSQDGVGDESKTNPHAKENRA